MLVDRNGDLARELVRKARTEAGLQDTDETTAIANTLIDAVEQDLIARANQAVVDEERLTAVETQSRVTAEAVMAIAGAVQNAAPAILELQDQLDTYRAPEE